MNNTKMYKQNTSSARPMVGKAIIPVIPLIFVILSSIFSKLSLFGQLIHLVKFYLKMLKLLGSKNTPLPLKKGFLVEQLSSISYPNLINIGHYLKSIGTSEFLCSILAGIR